MAEATKGTDKAAEKPVGPGADDVISAPYVSGSGRKDVAPEEDEDAKAKILDPVVTADPLPKTVKARVCREKHRAPEGYQRFRVRAINYAGYGHLYILAAKGDIEAAKACYIKESGLGAHLEDLEEIGGERNVTRPRLNVLPLND